jgi:ATP-dependent protease ClpP protease subunit
MAHDYRRINGYKAKLLGRVRALQPSLANDLTELKLPWYYIRDVAPEVGEEGESNDETAAEVFIYDEIGGSFGVDANEFIQDLQGIKAKEITVRINSPGGSVFDAIAIYNSLIQHPANITTRVDAMAASAASIIAMAGDTVEMMVGSQLMIHDAMGTEMGNARDMREMAKFLDLQSDNLASIYANKAGDKQDWRALMLAETWMFAQEAVDFGLADSVYERAVKQAFEDAGIDPTEEPEEDEEQPSEDEEESEDAEDEAFNKALTALMNRPHRLTNRGYKYSGRNKAPAPKAKQSKSSALPGYKDAMELLDMISNWR